MSTRLPPLNAVRVFEACARHLNFTRAAAELSVTHSAVSKQIAVLEDFVGETLFTRTGGRVSLTDDGRRLRDEIAPAFDILAQAFSRHRRGQPGSCVLRVSTVASFAAQVLMPLRAALAKALDSLHVEITTSDRPLDLSREAVDVAIRYGKGNWSGLTSTPLVPGRLLAVVRPDLIDVAMSLSRVQTNASDEWAAMATEHRPAGPAIVLEHFVVALEAAVEGVGVALLPDILVRRSVESGRLKTLPMPSVDWPDTFHVVCDPASRRRDDIESFHQALVSLL